MTEIAKGCAPSKGQGVVYVDDAFELLTAGQIAFLETVMSIESSQHAGLEPYLIVGIYDDTTVFKCKGIIFPMMNMAERALLILQTRVNLKHPFVCDLVSPSDQLVVRQRRHSLGSIEPTLKLFSLLPPSIRDLFDILRSRYRRRIPS